VRYDHVTGNRFRHGTKFLRWRPTRRPSNAGWTSSRMKRRRPSSPEHWEARDERGTDRRGRAAQQPRQDALPEQGITKAELADYYVAVAEHMLRTSRPPGDDGALPHGPEKKCFYQRHAGSGVLPQLHPITVPGFDDPISTSRTSSGLVAMVQMGTLEIHPGASPLTFLTSRTGSSSISIRT
jgi:hypothetical protein